MIRRTLSATKAATFAVHLPSVTHAGLPVPVGTGFMISETGLVLTARHVITENGAADGPVRADVSSMVLMKEIAPPDDPQGTFVEAESYIGLELQHEDSIADIALFSIDVSKNVDRQWLKDRPEFPHLTVGARILEEGEAVYAFGYPLSSGQVIYPGPDLVVGQVTLSPRVTSAIVSSRLEAIGTITEAGPQLHYVLDKALNYGNSGGPIMSTETGQVHALCSRFQPVYIPQAHLQRRDGYLPMVMIPSLYGVVINLAHPRVLTALREHGASVAPTVALIVNGCGTT